MGHYVESLPMEVFAEPIDTRHDLTVADLQDRSATRNRAQEKEPIMFDQSPWSEPEPQSPFDRLFAQVLGHQPTKRDYDELTQRTDKYIMARLLVADLTESTNPAETFRGWCRTQLKRWGIVLDISSEFDLHQQLTGCTTADAVVNTLLGFAKDQTRGH